MDINFCDINPTTNIIADDVMIHGNTDEEHDCHLIQVLNKCHEIGLKLNPDKCELGKSEVTFYGNVVSDQGFKPDPCKVDAIVRMPAPNNKTELLSFLGMVNYLAPYIPKLSDCTATLRQINKKNTNFVWNSVYEKAFRNAKLHVANTVMLKFFDPDKDIVIECDASGVSIGGTLLQDGHPITFISQALTSTQQHYSNIECELLAVVVIVEHLHHYIFGRKFMVHTDHSPLANIFKKCLNDTSPRLQCLLLRLSQYEMDVCYVMQKHVPIANCLSRLVDNATAMEDELLNLQIADLGVENVRIDWANIRHFSMNDPTLVCLARVIQFGWPENSTELPNDVKPFYRHRCELHIVDGIIFFHNRIVVPIGLRRQFLNKLHDSHLGIAKTKLMARMLVYWPKWNEDIDKLCAECSVCHENENMPANVPKFQVEAMYPGHIYGRDVADIGQHRQHLVLVDYFSCAVFEHRLKSLQSSDVIDALKDMFCDIGTPDKLISDNAKYFISDEFSRFMMDWSICHITSSPRYPQGNAHAEKAVGVVKQLYECCQDVNLGLLLLKTTPISNQKGDPAVKALCHSFYGCQLKAHLPLYRSANFSLENTCTLGTETDGAENVNDVPSKYSVDQDIWAKLDTSTKKWEPSKIIEIWPNRSHTVELTNGHIFRRNEHHLTRRLGCIKHRTTSEADNTQHAYNLCPRKLKKSVSWPDFPIRNTEPVDFELPDML